MTQLSGPGMVVQRAKPGLDIYGVLLIIATAFVAAATVFLLVRSADFFGSPFPIGGA